MKKPRKSKTLSIRELTSEVYNSKKLSGKIDSIEILNTWNEITNKLIQDRTEKVSISEEKIVFVCQTFFGKTTAISGSFLFKR